MTQAVAEIVTFTLSPNVSSAEFVAISQQSEAFVRAQPGFVRRHLSCGENGQWTDYVVWADMDLAHAAMKAFPEQGFAPALMAAISPESVTMRHEMVLWDISSA